MAIYYIFRPNSMIIEGTILVKFNSENLDNA